MDASKEVAHAALGASTGWTNEKHNLYLDSLETSFVNELYHSLRLREGQRQRNAGGTHSPQEFSFKTQDSTDQVGVVQGSSLQKIKLQRTETLMESTADSHVTRGNPRIFHSTSANKICNVSSPRMLTLRNFYASARRAEQNRLCHQDLVGNTTEISGQNFANENHGGMLSNESIPKRLKIAAAEASSNDQIVPSRNSDKKEVSMVHNVLSEGEEQGHKKSGLHHLLGGSIEV